MKIHFYSPTPEREMPEWMRAEYHSDGLRGTLCGYMRRTTTKRELVTCSRCQKLMREQERAA
ncbi:hypothetical protein ACMS02_001430 [Cronobacter turicensis]